MSLKEKILSVRRQHPEYSNARIAKEVGCAKSTVWEHLRKSAEGFTGDALAERSRQLLRRNEDLEMALANENMLADMMRASVRALPKVKKVATKTPKSRVSDTPMEAVLIMADEHAEEVVDPVEVGYINHYDWKTFLCRSWALVEKTVKLVDLERKSNPVDKLHIWKLGDNLTGEIHPHDAYVAQEFGVAEAIPNVANIFAQQVSFLSSFFREIEVTGVVGNHTRTTKKMPFKKTAERSFDRTIYRLAEMMCSAQDNVKWNISKALQANVDILGWRNLLTHGTEINMTSRVPYYPIETTIQRENGMRRQAARIMAANMNGLQYSSEFDFAWMGHFHHRAILSDNIYLCPSLIGSNQFSKNKVHQMSMPRQLLVFFTKKHGVTVERAIDLAYASEHGFVDPAGRE